MQYFGALHLTVMTGARFYKYLAAMQPVIRVRYSNRGARFIQYLATMQPVIRVRFAIRNARFSQHFGALHLMVLTGNRFYKYLATL